MTDVQAIADKWAEKSYKWRHIKAKHAHAIAGAIEEATRPLTDIIVDLRRKLAIAGVEGSPPPGGEGTIQRLLRERKAALARVGKLAESLTKMCEFGERQGWRHVDIYAARELLAGAPVVEATAPTQCPEETGDYRQCERNAGHSGWHRDGEGRGWEPRKPWTPEPQEEKR